MRSFLLSYIVLSILFLLPSAALSAAPHAERKEEQSMIVATGRTQLIARLRRMRTSAIVLQRNRRMLVSRIITLTNRERVTRGLPPYRTNVLLTNSAQSYADDMEHRGYFSHVSPEGEDPKYRIKATGYMDVDFKTCNCTRYEIKVGENLARGFASAETIVEGWMKSTQGHRENILSEDFEEIGVGISASGEYWVQHFGAVKTE